MLEWVWMKFRNVLLVGDFNCDRSGEGGILGTSGRKLQSVLHQFEYRMINKQPTRITKDTSTLIDLAIASKIELVKKTRTLELGIWDHILVHASLETTVKRPPPKIVKARSYKHFNKELFVKDIEEAPWSVCSIFEDPDNCYGAWLNIFNDICDKHAPYREIKVRRQSLPWITPQIRHAMNIRYKTLLQARQTSDPELWRKYHELRNKLMQEVRSSKTKYYIEQFDKVKDCKSYWKLIKNTYSSQKAQPKLGIRRTEGTLGISNEGKANILNEYFSTVGEKLADELPEFTQEERFSHVTRITPTKMHIILSNDTISQSLKALKSDKSCGPDKVAPMLLKHAGNSLVPSLMSLYASSILSKQVPRSWKLTNVTPLFKKEDELDKENYRPISL